MYLVERCVQQGALHRSSKGEIIGEQLAIFLHIMGHSSGNRNAQEHVKTQVTHTAQRMYNPPRPSSTNSITHQPHRVDSDALVGE